MGGKVKGLPCNPGESYTAGDIAPQVALQSQQQLQCRHPRNQGAAGTGRYPIVGKDWVFEQGS